MTAAHLDDVYRHRATISLGVVGFYLVLIALLLVAGQNPSFETLPTIIYLFAAVLVVFLARYLSTRYWMDAERLGAWRIFGSRTVRLEEVRRIERANLRDLGPVGMIGSWGWRGRMWSPTIGSFDAIQTVSDGILVTVGRVPLFISPRDPTEFARELSRRVRSYTGPLEVDVGAPSPPG